MLGNETFPKYIKYGDAACVLIGYDTMRDNIFNEHAKYVGFDGKNHTTVLLISYSLGLYTTKLYIDSMLIYTAVISQTLRKIPVIDFIGKCTGTRIAANYRADAINDLKNENVYLRWTI